jgi:Coenzyme PQQ synthesis protein D (PqqD)
VIKDVPVSFSNRLLAHPDVLIREVEGEAVILDLKTERYLGLNKVGMRMWSALTACDCVQTAYDQLISEFDVDPDVLQRDLSDLIEKLIAEGLVEIHP